MAKSINNQAFGTKLINSGVASTEFYTLLEALVNLEILDGKGSPEGLVFARFKVQYLDTLTNDLYIKTTNNNVNTGWVL